MKKNSFPLYLLHIFFTICCLLTNTYKAQTFPNTATLSTGQGANGTNDPIWQVSNWFNVWPTGTLGLTYNPAFISNNCAPGQWIDPASLAPPLNNGNWISSAGMPCDGISFAYVAFRLTLNLPADCNGNSLATAGNYVLSFDGYVDNILVDVLINGVSENIVGLPGGSFVVGGQVNIVLDGPWVPGINYVDFVVNNNLGGGGNLSSMGDGDPYGLLLVANSTFGSTNDSDNDGIVDLDDLCPCNPGTNPFGCTDPNLFDCDVTAIRQAFTAAGCTEIPACADDCSVYFLNPASLSGTDAQVFAQNLGANLISVQSAAENQCIINELNNIGQTGVIWIGFNDEAVEGNFVWYDQSPVTYTNWATGEPNNSGGNENYVQIYPNGQWNDLAFGGAAVSIIEVNLCPVITASPDVTICNGNTAILTASTTLFGSNPYTYTWDNGTIGQNNSVTPTTTTEYIVTTEDRYSCTTTDTVEVTVNTVPIAASSYTVGCLDFLAQFTDLSTIGAGGTINQWLWDFGNGSTSTAQNPSHQYAMNGVYNGSLTVTSTNNCSHTAPFIVNAPPPTIVKITDNNPLCDPNSLNWVTWNSVGGNNANGTISSDISMTLIHSVGGMSTTPVMFSGATFPPQYNVPITSTSIRNDLAGLLTFCFNQTVSNPQIAFSSIGNSGNPVQINTSEPYNIIWTGVGMTYPNSTSLIGTEGYTIISFPGTHTCITFDYLQSEAYCNIAFGIQDTNCQVKPKICEGESVTLTGTGALDYIWSPAQGLNTTTGATVIASPTVTTTYYAVDANDVGCSYMDSVKIIVHPLPQPTFTQTNVCLGSIMNFTNTSTIVSGTIDSYFWNFGDGGGTSQIQNPSYTYLTAGIFNLELSDTSNFGCAASVVIPVTVYENPVANFTLTDVCAETAYQFIDASTSNDGTITNWNWDFTNNGTVDNTQQNTSHIYPTFGNFDVNLSISTDLGCTHNITQSVTVFQLPTVSFTAPSVCQGSATAFTDNTVANNGTITNWNWDFQNNGSIDATVQNPTFNYPSFGSYSAQLSVTSSNGCVNDTLLSVIVNEIPVASFTSANVCLGTVMNFTNTSTLGTGTIASYAWNFGDGAGTSTLENPSYTYLTSGTFSVSLTVISNNGCSHTTTQTINVVANPIAGFTAPNGCNQTASIMTSTANGNGGVINLTQWDFTSNGTIDFTGTNASFTYPNAGTFTITQIVSTGVGCADTTTQTITINPNPSVQFTVQNVCVNNTVAFTNTSAISSGAINTYDWDFGNGNTSTQISPSELYTFEGVFTVTLTTISDNNCSSMLTQPIEIYPTPQSQFLLDNICEDEIALFTSISQVSNQNTTNSITNLAWNFGVVPAATSTGQFANHLYSNPGTFTVTLVATTNRGCIGTVQQDIIVHPKPMIDFISFNNQGCSELCVNFTNNSSVMSGTINEWFWNFGDGSLSSLANDVHCYTNELPMDQFFTVTLTGISNQGCQSSLTQSNFVTVFGKPIADFEPSKYITSFYQTQIDFTNTSSLATDFFWNFYDVDSSIIENPYHIFPFADSGFYDVCLTVSSINGCLDSICKGITITGAPNLYIPNAFTPNNDGDNELFIPYLSGVLQREFTFMIFDRWGVKIYETDNPFTISWDGTYQGSPAPIDTYVWKLKGLNQYDFSEINMVGHVNLIR